MIGRNRGSIFLDRKEKKTVMENRKEDFQYLKGSDVNNPSRERYTK